MRTSCKSDCVEAAAAAGSAARCMMRVDERQRLGCGPVFDEALADDCKPSRTFTDFSTCWR